MNYKNDKDKQFLGALNWYVYTDIEYVSTAYCDRFL